MDSEKRETSRPVERRDGRDSVVDGKEEMEDVELTIGEERLEG